jgi:hypothetical protein
MDRAIWTLAKLTPEQEHVLKEAEATMGAGVLLAFRHDQLAPSQLTESQLECLRGLEQKLGLVVVALRAA